MEHTTQLRLFLWIPKWDSWSASFQGSILEWWLFHKTCGKHPALDCMMIVWQTNLFCLGLLGAGNVTATEGFLGEGALNSMIWLRFVRCPFPSRCHGFGVRAIFVEHLGSEWLWILWGRWPPPTSNGGLTWFQRTGGIELKGCPHYMNMLKMVQSTTPR